MTGIRSAFDDIAVFRGRLFLLVAVVGLVIAGLTIPFQLNGRLWSELFNLAHAPVFCGLALLIAGIRDGWVATAAGLFDVFGHSQPLKSW